ncbi:hypothetical protein ACA910_006906 [Epithemia clementina (nom. ined.)]
MIRALSQAANFTYDLLPPSGLGADCTPRLMWDELASPLQLYDPTYFQQYNCGANDVTEIRFDDDGSNGTTATTATTTTTDIYAGMFYISPERQRRNRFTMPFSPPEQGTQVMYGTATRLRTIDDLIQAQQKQRDEDNESSSLRAEDRPLPPACVYGSTAVAQMLAAAYPELQLRPFFGTEDEVWESMYNGTCPVHIYDAPIAAQFVRKYAQRGQCQDAQGQPIGVIGQSLSFGLTHYALGVGHRVPEPVVDALSYWTNVFMTCNPNDHDATALCQDAGNLHSMYEAQGGGTGSECGYVDFPVAAATASGKSINVPLLVGVLVGGLCLLLTLFFTAHVWFLKRQEQRYKYRFVEQIARNIEIGPSPGLITPEKLAQEIQHICHGKNTISKADMMQWMNDIKLTFLSERDLNALWDAMDVHKDGYVDPIEFILFLSACGPQFAQVHAQHQRLPKTERLKLAARRLTNLALVGEEGVRRIQYKLDRGSKELPPPPPTPRVTPPMDSEAMDVTDSSNHRPWTWPQHPQHKQQSPRNHDWGSFLCGKLKRRRPPRTDQLYFSTTNRRNNNSNQRTTTTTTRTITTTQSQGNTTAVTTPSTAAWTEPSTNTASHEYYFNDNINNNHNDDDDDDDDDHHHHLED